MVTVVLLFTTLYTLQTSYSISDKTLFNVFQFSYFLYNRHTNMSMYHSLLCGLIFICCIANSIDWKPHLSSLNSLENIIHFYIAPFLFFVKIFFRKYYTTVKLKFEVVALNVTQFECFLFQNRYSHSAYCFSSQSLL